MRPIETPIIAHQVCHLLRCLLPVPCVTPPVAHSICRAACSVCCAVSPAQHIVPPLPHAVCRLCNMLRRPSPMLRVVLHVMPCVTLYVAHTMYCAAHHPYCVLHRVLPAQHF